MKNSEITPANVAKLPFDRNVNKCQINNHYLGIITAIQ